MTDQTISAIAASAQSAIKIEKIKLAETVVVATEAPIRAPNINSVQQFKRSMDSSIEKVSTKTPAELSNFNFNAVDGFRNKFTEIVNEQLSRKMKIDLNPKETSHLTSEMQEMIAKTIEHTNKQAEFTLLMIGVQGASEAKKSVEQSAKTLIQG